MRLRHLVQVNPPQSSIRHLPDDTEVVFAPMEALADGLGGLDTTATRTLAEVGGGSYSYFAEGDLLLAKVTPCFENGKKAMAVDLPHPIGFATSEVHVIRLRSETISRRYLNYLFSSQHFAFTGVSSMTGAGGLRRVSEDAVLNYRLPITDHFTQERIADLLDRETARIDHLVERKQRLVDLLTTKENDDLARMYNNLQATEWKLRHLGVLKGGAGFPIDLQGITDGEVAFFKVKHLREHGLASPLREADDYIDRNTARSLRATIFPPNAIVFAKIGAALLLARFSILGVDACIDNNMCAFVPNQSNIDPRFALLALSLMNVKPYVNPGAIPSLNMVALQDHRIKVPGQDVQETFVNKWKLRTERYTELSRKITRSITLLQELRTSLITAAVTGLIDIDNWRKKGETERRLEAIAAAEEAEVREEGQPV